LEPNIGEMKRFFVRPAFRGMGLGKKLTRMVLEEAARIGYERIRLDTMPWMVEAVSLDESLGFRRIAPYGLNPICGAVHMEIVLKSAEGIIGR
jgi:ribosomal protein S18 acetylase RimI-like enzyme